MNAEQSRFADAIDRLHLSLAHLNGNIIALERLFDGWNTAQPVSDPTVKAIRAVFDGIQFHATTAEDQADDVWKLAAGLLAELERANA